MTYLNPIVAVVGIPGESAIVGFAGATAVVGVIVAGLAFWGYRRNDSRPMLYLAAGIVLLTTIPVGVNYLLMTLTATSDAKILLVVSAAHLAGVASIFYALTRA